MTLEKYPMEHGCFTNERFFMKLQNKYVLALTAVAVSLLTACGGGGGGGSAGGGMSGTVVSVSPSLGKFSAGAVVVIKNLAGSELGRGTIGADGKAAVNVGSYSGAIVVEVLGAAGVTYFDEGSNTTQSFGVGEKLTAISPDVRTSIGVTPATHAAVEVVKVANSGIISVSIQTTAIDLANTKIATALGITNVLQAPALVDSTTSTTGTKLDIANVQDKYALQLAALAKLATSGKTALDVSKSLAQDLSDGKIDGQQGPTVLTPAYNKDTVVANMATQLQNAANDFGTSTTSSLVAADPSVLGTVQTDVTTVTAPTTGASTSDVQLAKDMISELRTTFGAVLSNFSGSFLKTQAQRAADDLAANVAPNMEKVVNRLATLGMGVKLYETVTTSPGSLGQESLHGTNVYYLNQGSLWGLWNGQYASYKYCFTPNPATSPVTVTCLSSSAEGVDRVNKLVKLSKYVVTSTGANSYTYEHSAVKLDITTDSYGNYVDFSGTAYEFTPAIPHGTGTVTKTWSNGVASSYAITGTMIPFTGVTGLDSINISGTRTSLGGYFYQYDLQGSVATPSTADSSKVVTIALDNGSYVVKDESTGKSGSMLLKMVAQTVATKFTGTFKADNAVLSYNDGYQPSHLNFKGTVADTSTGGAGEFLTGTVDANFHNLATYNRYAPESTTNYKQIAVSFTGTVQATSRPLMKLVLAGTATGPNSGTTTLNYSYGTVSITGTGTQTNGIGAMTLNNQAGLQIAKDSTDVNQTLITKAGNVLAKFKNGVMNYVDGTSVTF